MIKTRLKKYVIFSDYQWQNDSHAIGESFIVINLINETIQEYKKVAGVQTITDLTNELSQRRNRTIGSLWYKSIVYKDEKYNNFIIHDDTIILNTDSKIEFERMLNRLAEMQRGTEKYYLKAV